MFRQLLLPMECLVFEPAIVDTRSWFLVIKAWASPLLGDFLTAYPIQTPNRCVESIKALMMRFPYDLSHLPSPTRC